LRDPESLDGENGIANPIYDRRCNGRIGRSRQKAYYGSDSE